VTAAIDPGRHWLGVRPHEVELVAETVPGAVAATLRFIENFGATHVLHAEYGGDLIRVETAPGAWSIGKTLYLRFASGRVLLLIDRVSERVVPFRSLEAAA
jgi:hypothetical protein